MDPRNVWFVSKKRGAPTPEEEFKFQPEPKRNGRGKGPIRPGPRTKGAVHRRPSLVGRRATLLLRVILLPLLEMLKT